MPALAYERLAAEAAEEEDAEERRLFYVAMTRACDRLILSGTADPERQSRAAPRRPAAGLDRARARWAAPGGADRHRRRRGRVERVLHGSWDGRPTRVLTRLVTPATIAPDALRGRARRSGTPGTALPARPKVIPAPTAGRPAPQRLSYTALGQYAKLRL